MYVTRLLIYWYRSQRFCVRWGSTYSELFSVTNGVRQGGILLPYLFNVYFDDLSEALNKIYCGCAFNNTIVNHMMYADDLVVFAPSIRGLQTLVNMCENFAETHDVIFNSHMSVSMIFRPKGETSYLYDSVYLNNECIKVVSSTKYLGHYLANDLSDDLDIKRQCMCSVEVKLFLFQSYCSPMYTAHL